MRGMTVARLGLIFWEFSCLFFIPARLLLFQPGIALIFSIYELTTLFGISFLLTYIIWFILVKLQDHFKQENIYSLFFLRIAIDWLLLFTLEIFLLLFNYLFELLFRDQVLWIFLANSSQYV